MRDGEDTHAVSFSSQGSDAEYAVYALEDDDNVVGVLALSIHARAFRSLRPEFLHALSRALFPKVSTLTREEALGT